MELWLVKKAVCSRINHGCKVSETNGLVWKIPLCQVVIRQLPVVLNSIINMLLHLIVCQHNSFIIGLPLLRKVLSPLQKCNGVLPDASQDVLVDNVVLDLREIFLDTNDFGEGLSHAFIVDLIRDAVPLPRHLLPILAKPRYAALSKHFLKLQPFLNKPNFFREVKALGI